MALTVTNTPGKQFAATEKVTVAKLNQLGQPTFTVTGTLATAELSDASVTAAKTAVGAHFYTSSVSFGFVDPTSTYTLTYSPVPTIVDGTLIAFKASAASMGATQIAIGASNKKLLKNKTATLAKGDVVLNTIVEARYDSTADAGAGAWQMTSQVGNAEGFFTTTGAANAYVATVTPPGVFAFALADLEGRVLRLKIHAANTGASTLQVIIGGTTLAVKNLVKGYNTAVGANDLPLGQIVEVTYNVTSDSYQLLGQVGYPATDSAPIASSRDLVIQNVGGNSLTSVIITATEVVLRNGDGRNYSASTVSVTAAITAAGVNGLDAGAEGASTWYYIWVISNGTTVASLLSASSSNPTMPTGYTTSATNFKALVGAVYNGAGSDFSIFYQAGREVFYNDAMAPVFTATGGSASLSSQSVTAWVPPNAKVAWGTAGTSSAITDSVAGIGVAGNGAGMGLSLIMLPRTAVNFGNFFASGRFRVPLMTAQTIFVITYDISARYRLEIKGFLL